MVLVAGALFAWAHGRPGWTGVLIGLGTATKLYPLFLLGGLLIICLRERRWRDLAVATAAAGRRLAGRQRAGVPHRTRAVEGVLGLQQRPRRRPRLGLAGHHPGRGPHLRREHDQPVVVGDLRGLVRGRVRARDDRAGDAAARPARLPGRRGLPAGQQGLLAAVRAVAAAARGAGPAALARPAHLAGERAPLLRVGVVVPRR